MLWIVAGNPLYHRVTVAVHFIVASHYDQFHHDLKASREFRSDM